MPRKKKEIEWDAPEPKSERQAKECIAEIGRVL